MSGYLGGRRRADAQGSGTRAARPRHPARDAALRARHAHRLPLRAAGRDRRRRGVRPALGRDRLHVAARALPCVATREPARRDRRAGARNARPERDLGRQDARRACVPRRCRAGRAARVRALLRTARRRRAGRRCARDHRHLRRRLADLGARVGRARARGRPAAAPAAARDPTRRRRRRGCHLGRAAATTCSSSVSTTSSSRYFRGPRSSTSSPSRRTRPCHAAHQTARAIAVATRVRWPLRSR